MTATEQEEYRALRATIRERGTARVCVFLVGAIAWASLLVATTALAAPPVAALVPLLVLASTFEAVYALHIGVERVGRYLAVFFDDSWERAAMAFGRPPNGARADALFTTVFALAALFNFAPTMVVQPTMPEIVFVGGAHALFIVRLAFAKLTASKQRAVDQQRFQVLRNMDGHEDTKARGS